MAARLSGATQRRNQRHLKARFEGGFSVVSPAPRLKNDGQLSTNRHLAWAVEVIRMYRRNLEYNTRVPYPDENVFCHRRASKSKLDDSAASVARRWAVRRAAKGMRAVRTRRRNDEKA